MSLTIAARLKRSCATAAKVIRRAEIGWKKQPGPSAAIDKSSRTGSEDRETAATRPRQAELLDDRKIGEAIPAATLLRNTSLDNQALRAQLAA
jgi:hypothetical protein